MSPVIYIFIFYIIISLLTRMGNKGKKHYALMQKEEDGFKSVVSEIQDKSRHPGEKNNAKQVDNIEKKEKITVDDEVKEHYQKRNINILKDKPVIEVKEEIIPDHKSGLEVYLSDNILVNGVIFSEIIAPPRALRPYDFQKYRKLG